MLPVALRSVCAGTPCDRQYTTAATGTVPRVRSGHGSSVRRLLRPAPADCSHGPPRVPRAEQGKRCTWRRSGRRRAQCMGLQRRAYLHCTPTQTHGHRVPWVRLSEGDVCRRTTGRPCRWLSQQQLTLHGSSAKIRTLGAHENIVSGRNLLQCRCGEGQRRKFWRN